MPARRSNYSLLSLIPVDQFAGATSAPPLHSASGDGKNYGSNNNKGKVFERGFDWDSVGADQRQGNRTGNLYLPSIGLQRQSSGSSFGESSLSGECYAPMQSTVAGNEVNGFGYVHEDGFKFSGGGGDVRARVAENVVARSGGSLGKSWAQQTEESYQLQLALALRLSSEATCADDPNFLDPVPDESALRSSSLANSGEVVSHRFWVG
ncbi:hypothetical protein RIF29_39799 [Crotalaria pallida]|uniref:Uncharacterized protein n=1 Tax=Crotalaria pallida TaxID=3830 RepID=A0AAN9E2G8_CROPI